MPRRGGRSVSVRRDKSAREANRPAMGAHSFDGARSAAQISILHRYTTQCGERLRAVVRDSIPIVPLDRSIDRSERRRGEMRRDERRGEERATAAAQFAGSLGASCVLSHPTTTERGGGGLAEEERARKKSVVNWDQDVTPRARGRIGTWSGSYTYPTGTGTGAFCGSRTRACAHTHTHRHTEGSAVRKRRCHGK